MIVQCPLEVPILPYICSLKDYSYLTSQQVKTRLSISIDLFLSHFGNDQNSAVLVLLIIEERDIYFILVCILKAFTHMQKHEPL